MPESSSPTLRASGALAGTFEKVEGNSEERMVLGLILILAILGTISSTLSNQSGFERLTGHIGESQ